MIGHESRTQTSLLSYNEVFRDCNLQLDLRLLRFLLKAFFGRQPIHTKPRILNTFPTIPFLT
jgi:hypothetical protein